MLNAVGDNRGFALSSIIVVILLNLVQTALVCQCKLYFRLCQHKRDLLVSLDMNQGKRYSLVSLDCQGKRDLLVSQDCIRTKGFYLWS